MSKPKLLDLFAGVGGFSLGFEEVGYETVAFAEIDPFASKVLAHRWPSVPNLGDVTEIDGEEVRERFGHIDVVTFGSPCQDWSVAGKRLGLEGHRSSLFHEAIRIIRGVRPTFAVFENVPGLFSSAGGWDFAVVLDEMAESGALDIAWSVLDAQWFGVPQRRRRVFVVCDFGGERAGEILSIAEGVCRDTQESREEREGSPEGPIPSVEATLGGRMNRSHTDIDRNGAYIPEPTPFDRTQMTVYHQERRDDPALTSKSAPLIPFNYLEDDFGDESETTAPSQTAGRGEGRTAIVEATGFYANAGYKDDPVSGASAPLKGTEQNSGQAAVAFETRVARNGRGAPSETVNALKAEAEQTGKGDAAPCTLQGMAVRRLTPLECERLMGWPDGWTDVPGASDSGRYRACGNGVASVVVRWIARGLREVM